MEYSKLELEVHIVEYLAKCEGEKIGVWEVCDGILKLLNYGIHLDMEEAPFLKGASLTPKVRHILDKLSEEDLMVQRVAIKSGTVYTYIDKYRAKPKSFGEKTRMVVNCLSSNKSFKQICFELIDRYNRGELNVEATAPSEISIRYDLPEFPLSVLQVQFILMELLKKGIVILDRDDLYMRIKA